MPLFEKAGLGQICFPAEGCDDVVWVPTGRVGNLTRSIVE